MKKIISFLVLMILMLAVGCEGNTLSNRQTPEENATSAPVAKEEQPTEAPETPQVLVAYFSNTGNTEAVATELANLLGADKYAITAQVPYTAEDLDYNNAASRANTEQNDPKARPEIDGTVENMSDYSVVFVGYPIWWGDAPRIMETFMESYDFAGKIIIPFCTSGSSGIGSSAEALQALTTDAQWLEGRRFDASVDAAVLQEWLKELASSFYGD